MISLDLCVADTPIALCPHSSLGPGIKDAIIWLPSHKNISQVREVGLAVKGDITSIPCKCRNTIPPNNYTVTGHT